MSTAIAVWTHAEPLDVTIEPFALEDFQRAYDWKFKGIPAKQRPMSFAAFVQQSVVDAGKKMREYADTQAYNQIEKLVFQSAKIQNITPLEAASKMGVTLRES